MSTVAIGIETEEEAVTEATYPRPIEILNDGERQTWWEHRPGVIAIDRDVTPEGYVDEEYVESRLRAIDPTVNMMSLNELSKATTAAGLPPRKTGRYHVRNADGSYSRAGVYTSYPERTVQAMIGLVQARLGLSWKRDCRHLLTQEQADLMFPSARFMVEEVLARWEGDEQSAHDFIAKYIPPGPAPAEGERPSWLTDGKDLSWEWVEQAEGGPGWCRNLIGEYVTDCGVIEVVRYEEVAEDGTIHARDGGTLVDLGSLDFEKPLPMVQAGPVLRDLAARLIEIADLLAD